MQLCKARVEVKADFAAWNKHRNVLYLADHFSRELSDTGRLHDFVVEQLSRRHLLVVFAL